MVVAFDFDGVFDSIKMQGLIKKLKAERNEIWVVTARSDNEYNKKIVEAFLGKLGISKSSVIYAGGKRKVDFIEAINADIYIDNITDELSDINDSTNTIAVLFKN